MRRFWLVQALHYQPNGFSITPKPDKNLDLYKFYYLEQAVSQARTAAVPVSDQCQDRLT